MSSMTDIVFLLLIFFMVTSTQIAPNGLQVTLPQSSSQVKLIPHVSVSINAAGQYAVNTDVLNKLNHGYDKNLQVRKNQQSSFVLTKTCRLAKRSK